MENKLLTVFTTLIVLIASSTQVYSDNLAGFKAYQKKDYVTAIREYTKDANKGNFSSQYKLGNMYYQGIGVPQNFQTAAMWYEKASNHDDLGVAQYKLAEFYFKGVGVQKNIETAAKWYEKSAENGYLFSILSIGLLYQYGIGVSKNEVQAHKWLNIAS